MQLDKVKTYDQLYEQIVEGNFNYGTGIWAYLNNKISMRLNRKGEYVPFKNEKDELSKAEVKKLIDNTPLLAEVNESEIAKDLFSNIQGIKYNKKIGYYQQLYVGHVLEGNFRSNGSSGGISSWLFKELMEREDIDGVIEVKKADDNNNNILFEYGISKSISEITEGAKTKYYPIEYSKVLDFVRKKPGNYAIIGLPSYVMGIRLLTKNDSILKKRIKYVIGLVCGHQKTINFANFLAWQCGIKPGNLINIDFRKKVEDMPSNSYAVEVTGKVNNETKTIVKPMSELMGGDWGQGFFKVPASDFTDDVMNETADITLGDAWLPEYTNDSEGNNIVVVRNSYLQSIIEDGVNNGKLNLDIVDEKTIYRSQASHYRHTQDELSYRLYKKDMKGVWRPNKRVSATKDIPFLRKKIQDQREKITYLSTSCFLEAIEKDDLNYFLKKMSPLVRKYKFIYFIQRVQRHIKRKISMK